MTSRRWRLSGLSAAVILVPALVTGGAFLSMKYADTHRFDRCLAAVPKENQKDPGVAFVLADLKGTDRYAGATWNINKPYRKDAYNILVPSGSGEKWPNVCEVPEGIPDCLASPQNRYIICNPAMGRQFESRLLHSGAASPEEDAAMRYVLLTFLGHELGHIAMSGSSRSRHLTPGLREGGLSCSHHPTSRPSEEERADEFGTGLACGSVLRRLSSENLPTTPDEGLKLLSRLQDELDDSYFLSDDACVGDIDYPSIGRRKHTFGLKYLQCVYQAQWNPVEILAENDAKSFDNLEEWLGNRQLYGQVGSGSYGRAALYSHAIASLSQPNSYLTFDSTGVDSRLWLIRLGSNGVIQPTSIETWNSAGRVLYSQTVQQGRRFLISLSHDTQLDNGVLFDLSVTCAIDFRTCGPPTVLRRWPTPDGFLPWAGNDGSIAMVSKDSIEESPEPPGVKPSVLPHGLHLKSVDDAVVTLNREGAIILSRKGGGLHDLSVFRDGTAHRRLLMMPPAEGETLEATALRGGSLFLSSSVTPLTGEGSLFLWDCPSAILDRSTSGPADDCFRYKAPSQIGNAVAMATRDLSSMFDRSITFPEDCGDLIAIHHGGWIWLLDRGGGLQDLMPADGVVRCDLQARVITAFRARRIDRLSLFMLPVEKDRQTVLSLPVN